MYEVFDFRDRAVAAPLKPPVAASHKIEGIIFTRPRGGAPGGSSLLGPLTMKYIARIGYEREGYSSAPAGSNGALGVATLSSISVS